MTALPGQTSTFTRSQSLTLDHQLDAVIETALVLNRIVGAVVIVAHRGEIVYESAAGFAERETRTLMRPDTIFRLASVTKPIVSAAALAWGFGFGAAVLRDPIAAQTPESVGTYRWGGAYGHSWFVDPHLELTVVALTNTTIEGMAGVFPLAIRDAVYRGICC